MQDCLDCCPLTLSGADNSFGGNAELTCSAQRQSSVQPLIRTVVSTLLVTLSLLGCCVSTALGMEPTVTSIVSHFGDAIVVEAIADIPVPLGTVWEVLTDFEHMATIVGNVSVSKVIRREGNKIVVHQEGVARYGLLSYSFESEREIRIEPMKRIQTKTLSGNVKRMESESSLSQTDNGTQIRYRAEVELDSILAKLFGASFIRHEVEQQFLEMSKEMIRRQGLDRARPRRQ